MTETPQTGRTTRTRAATTPRPTTKKQPAVEKPASKRTTTTATRTAATRTAAGTRAAATRTTRTTRTAATRARAARAASTPTPITQGQHDGHNGEFTLNLPMVSLQFHRPQMPHVEMPHMSRQEVGHAVDVARSFLPPPERVIYYGGLGALAVFGVLEWPVAAAIGVGTMLAQRGRTEESKAWSRARTPAMRSARTRG
ncbi:hypothetical protein ACQP1V_20135 [Microtetraspora malaysiensis]|uniref:hypothetical protein n=1 Tax=Microtetraspora malaysiensis TaxID=161358 RepID=UPI003D945281